MKFYILLRLLFGLLLLPAALTVSAASLPDVQASSRLSPLALRPDLPSPLAESPTPLRAGDVVFTQIGGPLFARVAASSNTWVSHVGIIVGQHNGRWMVAESGVLFSRVTPLDRFLARSVHGQYAIKRFRHEMTPEQVALLNAAVERRLGKVYDFGFNLDATHSQFCSKFVYQVVRDSSGAQLGEVETFRSLFVHNANAPVWFWRAWFFGRIPWDRKTITPESQYESPLLVTVSEQHA